MNIALITLKLWFVIFSCMYPQFVGQVTSINPLPQLKAARGRTHGDSGITQWAREETALMFLLLVGRIG